MKFKLDENLSGAIASPLLERDHDVSTVRDEDLCGSPDGNLIGVCRQEARCLVTMDLGFANPARFRPQDHAGIVVIRLPGPASPDLLRSSMQTLALSVEDASPVGKLWIVKPGRVRRYQPLDDE